MFNKVPHDFIKLLGPWRIDASVELGSGRLEKASKGGAAKNAVVYVAKAPAERSSSKSVARSILTGRSGSDDGISGVRLARPEDGAFEAVARGPETGRRGVGSFSGPRQYHVAGKLPLIAQAGGAGVSAALAGGDEGEAGGGPAVEGHHDRAHEGGEAVAKGRHVEDASLKPFGKHLGPFAAFKRDEVGLGAEVRSVGRRRPAPAPAR